jgi:O-antigen/teichoic acid export membrane protein
VILALGQPLLWLFGKEFITGYPVMFILALGFLAHASVGPVEFVLNMLGEQNRCAFVLFAAAGLNLVLNFILIPHFGLMGAAIATAGSSAMAALLMACIAKRYLKLDLFIAWPRQAAQK